MRSARRALRGLWEVPCGRRNLAPRLVGLKGPDTRTVVSAGRTFDDPGADPCLENQGRRIMTASVASHNQIFVGIDVGGLSFAFVARLSAEKQIIRIAVEPTGGHEKALVK